MITLITYLFFLQSENISIKGSKYLWYIVIRSRAYDFDKVSAKGTNLWELPQPPLWAISIVPFIMDI